MSETTAGLVALALTAAGTGTSMAASAAEQDAMNQKTKQEVLRQKGIQKKSTGEFEKSLAAGAPKVAQQQIDSGAEARLADMQKTAALPIGGASPLEMSSSNAVQAGQAAAQMSQQAQAKAKLGVYSDFDLQQWIKNLRAQQQIGMYGQFARQSAQVLPYELQAAGRSAEDMRGAGTGLSAAGALVGLGGAAGAFGSGASAASSAPAGTMTLGETAYAPLSSYAVPAATEAGVVAPTVNQFSLMKFLTGLGGQGNSMFGSIYQRPKQQQSIYGQQ